MNRLVGARCRRRRGPGSGTPPQSAHDLDEDGALEDLGVAAGGEAKFDGVHGHTANVTRASRAECPARSFLAPLASPEGPLRRGVATPLSDGGARCEALPSTSGRTLDRR